MSLFLPDFTFQSVVDLSPKFLMDHGIRLVLLDVDNTLAMHGHPMPEEGVLTWLENLQNTGISAAIVSNNSKSRVQPFAERLGLPFVSRSCKPMGFGIRAFCKSMGILKNEAAMVGDQILTDIAAGNLHGLTTILVEPFELEIGPFFRVKRKWEHHYKSHHIKRKE